MSKAGGPESNDLSGVVVFNWVPAKVGGPPTLPPPTWPVEGLATGLGVS